MPNCCGNATAAAGDSGESAASESIIYMWFSPAFGSSVDFFSVFAAKALFTLPTKSNTQLQILALPVIHITIPTHIPIQHTYPFPSNPLTPMAITTRASNPRPAAAPSQPETPSKSKTKAPSRSKASSRSKANRPKTSRNAPGTKSASRATRRTLPEDDDNIDVPATPSRGTLTPDVIEETEPEAPISRNELRRLMRKEFERGLANARNNQSDSDRGGIYRVRKSRSRRRRRHYSSSESSTDSEDEKSRPKVSFLHHKEGTKPYFVLATHFPSIHTKYFRQIFFGTFQPENLTKLGVGISDRAPTDNDSQEVRGMVQLLQCMEVYSHIVAHFSQPAWREDLHVAFSQYRFGLAQMSVIYKFDSIRAYNNAFIRTRILLGQDDAAEWKGSNKACQDSWSENRPKMRLPGPPPILPPSQQLQA